MSLLHFDPAEVLLKKYAATTTSGAKKTPSIVRIELAIGDPYALASILRQLEEIETEQKVASAVARQAAEAEKRTRQRTRISARQAPLMLPYHGDGN